MAGLLLSSNVHLILNGQPLARGRKCTLVCAALYSIIEKHAQKDGYCFAGNSTLAAELDKKKDTVRQYLWLMKESGWIEVKYHMENNVMVRDGIYPMLDIDYKKKIITLKDGTVLSDRRDSSKAAKPSPRGNDAEVFEGSYEGVDQEESTRDIDESVDDKTPAATVEELTPEEKQVVTSKPEVRELTTVEQCALQTKNIEADNYDRRGNIVDDDLYHKLKLEVIAESEAAAGAEKQTQSTLAKQIEANTRPNNTSTEVATISNNAPAQQQTTTANPYGELATPMTSTRKNYDPAEKAFYDAAKSLGISITNHNQARKWVKEVVRTRGLESAVNYFDFMRLMFPKWQYEFKPTVKTAYDLTMKAAQIEQLIQRQREEKARKIDYDNIDFYGE